MLNLEAQTKSVNMEKQSYMVKSSIERSFHHRIKVGLKYGMSPNIHTYSAPL